LGYNHTQKIVNLELLIEIWNKQHITNLQIKNISALLHDKFIMGTFGDIIDHNKFPKLRTYQKFKTDFRLENYLVNLENHRHQTALSKFRISSHNLRIETGRYETPKVEPHERLCIFCNQTAVEHEEHFLLECSLYSDERIILYQACHESIENFENLEKEWKFQEIMKCKENNVIYALSKFIYTCMIKRSEKDPNSKKKKKHKKKKGSKSMANSKC
jgi:hypothetical protein